MAEQVQFVETDPNSIIAEIIAQFEQATGRVLLPAHIERLILNAAAYREHLVREGINYSANQNLVAFATGINLDYLGQLVGCTWLAAEPASCEITFTLIADHGGSVIPSGTRVSTSDGRWVFKTLLDLVADSGDTTGTVTAECTIVGAGANGYAASTVTNIMDPQSYITAATNEDVTGGGADVEADDRYRERIILATAQFSTAGSIASYKYHARSASSSIVDVDIQSVDPGTVQIYPLLEGAVVTPGSVLDLVYNACNAEDVRPLNDLVTVISPTVTTFTLTIAINVYATADPTDTIAAVEMALNALGERKRKKLGQDVPLHQVVAAVMGVTGVFSIDDFDGFTGLTVASNEVAKLTGVTVTIANTINE